MFGFLFYLTEDIIFGHEFKFAINTYLRHAVNHYETEIGREISSLADVIKYNENNPGVYGYNQTLLKFADATDGLRNLTYIKARSETRRRSTEFLESIFKTFGLDALATPCDSDVDRDLYSYGAFGGYPSITVSIKSY